MKHIPWLRLVGGVAVALSAQGAAPSRAQPAVAAPAETGASDALPSTESPPVPSEQAGGEPIPESAQEIHHRALGFYQSNAYDEAAKLAEQGAQVYPNAAYLQADIGWARLAMNDYKSAIDALQRALVLRPLDPYYRLALGRAYHGLRSYHRARIAYARAIGLRESTRGRAYDGHVIYHVWMGDAYRTFGLLREARAEYLRALELEPSHAYARAAARESLELQRRSAAQLTRETSAQRASSPTTAPHYAVLVNPLALVAGAITNVYAFGLELQAGGAETALDISAQLGFTGEGNSFHVPANAFGQAVLVGVRVGSGHYLDGWFFLPRVGPLHWGSDGWSFWAIGLELEVGYTIASDGSPAAIGQIGVGLRALLPSQPQLRLPAEPAPTQGSSLIPRTVQLKPMIGLMLDASLGVGWL
jgi:tetratricopeptide (TPR) repeat protein